MTVGKAMIKGMIAGLAEASVAYEIDKVRKKLTRESGVPVKALSYIGMLGIDFVIGYVGQMLLMREFLKEDDTQDEWKYENPNIFKEV